MLDSLTTFMGGNAAPILAISVATAAIQYCMTLKPQPAKQHGADGGPNSSSTPANRKPTKPQGSAKERAGLLYRVHRHFSDLPQLDYTRPTPNYDLAVKLFGGLATDKKAAKTDGKRKAKAGDFKIKRSEIESGTDEDEDEDDEDDNDEVDPRFFERPSSRLGFHRMTAIEEDETSSSRTVEYFRSAKPNDYPDQEVPIEEERSDDEQPKRAGE
ncbi:hypothetical protein TruAng_011255 [Truncatella angustata]|nr:hypothetical protein TruAng_011255 [Truncatella angustata]